MSEPTKSWTNRKKSRIFCRTHISKYLLYLYNEKKKQIVSIEKRISYCTHIHKCAAQKHLLELNAIKYTYYEKKIVYNQCCLEVLMDSEARLDFTGAGRLFIVRFFQHRVSTVRAMNSVRHLSHLFEPSNGTGCYFTMSLFADRFNAQ